MATLLARLADAASRRRRLVIGVWLALLLGGSWFSLHQSDRLSGGGWDVPGSSSVRVADELDTFPSFSSPALSILVTGRSRAAVLERLAAARATAARDPALHPKRPHLFVVSRFRRELKAGATRDEALRRALSSSGTAVVFSGAAVAVSLAGLFVIDVNAVRSMAIGAIVVVTISVLATVTLLPALLSLVGPGIERLRVRLPWRTGESGDPVFWRRWTEAVMAHPLRALALTVPLLLLVSAPLLHIRTYNRGLEQLPRTAEGRAATEQAQRLPRPGVARPGPGGGGGRAPGAPRPPPPPGGGGGGR